jgi:transcriptional regulator with XRE-family HTH domain
MISPTQMRAARAILDYSQGQVAEQIGIAANTLSKIESGQADPSGSRIQEIQSFYELNGIEFTQNDGVQRKKGEIKIYKGRDGFLDFYKYVLRIAEQDGGQFLVSNVNEALFDFWLGEELDEYVDRITKVENLSFKVLIKEGDYNFAASDYAEYKWIPEKSFTNVPFYIFGDHMAMILFNEHKDVSVYLIGEEELTKAQRNIFYSNWKDALVIPKAGDA